MPGLALTPRQGLDLDRARNAERPRDGGRRRLHMRRLVRGLRRVDLVDPGGHSTADVDGVSETGALDHGQ